MSYLPGKFVWFEHLSPDVDKARAFYARLLKWTSDGVPMGEEVYHMIQNNGVGIGGFRATPAPNVPSHWLGYMSVESVDDAAKRAARAGASIAMPPTDFPPAGRGAVLTDPVGASFAIWKSKDGDRADPPDKPPAGEWCWMELVATDRERAVGFYQEAFGYERETMPMANGPYELMKRGGKPRCGIMAAPMPGMPSAWMPYVAVDDCDAIAKAAQAAGAQVPVPPMDIPNVGRMAVLADPLGAAIGVIRLA